MSLGNYNWQHEKTRLYGYVHDFSVDYDSIFDDDILDIHKYLMKMLDIKCLDLWKKFLFDY